MDNQKWTPWIGLRRAVVHLSVRSVMVLPLWSVTVWLCTPVLNFLVLHWAILGVAGFVLLGPGIAIGYSLSGKLVDIAGMKSILLTALAVVFGWTIVTLGVVVSDALRPLNDWQYGLTMMATGIWAMAWLFKLGNPGYDGFSVQTDTTLEQRKVVLERNN